MKTVPQPIQTFFKWVSRILGVLMLLPVLAFMIVLIIFAFFAIKERAALTSWGVLLSACMGTVFWALLGFLFVRLGWRKEDNTPPPLPAWLAWLCWIGGSLIVCLQTLWLFIFSFKMAGAGTQLISEKAPKDAGALFFLVLISYGPLVGNLIWMLIGIVIVRWPGMRRQKAQSQPNPPVVPAAAPEPVKITSYTPRTRHWSSCNILHTTGDTHRLWQFDARGDGFTLKREHSSAPGQLLPPNLVAKSWHSLWQPKLNVAWLPPENVFLRVIELPKSNFEETLAMVELQLEKLSPLPVAQIVWMFHVLPHSTGDLQTVIVVIAARQAVEEFLGKLEGQGYLADRLEAPMLDQLEAMPRAGAGSLERSEAETSAWIYPAMLAGQNAAMVAWWCGGTLRNLSLVVLPPDGNRAKGLKDQLAQLTWAGELEGWLTTPPIWHLIAEGAAAAEWESVLRASLDESVRVASPLPAAELAARTARRLAQTQARATLLPQEFSARYHQQFVDRLWLHGLAAAGTLYIVGVIIYFCATTVLGYRTHQVEQQVAALKSSYTSALQLKARYDVLAERQDLKYAALDCWKIVAEQLPAGLSLQRLSFADGQKLSLNGTVPSDQIVQITDHFYDAVRKAKVDGQPMFDASGGEDLTYVQQANNVNWRFSLVLKHKSEEAP